MASDNKPALKRKNDSDNIPSKKVRFNNETYVKHFSNELNNNKEKGYYNNVAEDDDDDEEEEIEDFEKSKNLHGRVNLDGYNSDSDSNDEDNKNDDDFDMFADEDADKKKKDKKVKVGKMKRSDIEGEEWNVPEDEEEEKMMPFNMDKDLEEGDFDENGHYIPKKDENQVYDKWLEDISKSDIMKAKAAKEKQDERIRQQENEEIDIDINKNEYYKALIMIMKPRETVLSAMKRFGGNNQKVPKWKQKMLEKKNKNKKMAVNENPEKSQKSIEAITAISEKMMGLGDYSIYEESYESIVRKLRIAEELDDDWTPGGKVEISPQVIQVIPEIKYILENDK
ncbi:hypothetical protein BCR36DRAFT_341489 [Piromyces finnis]|uniref:GYF domain-containing protein n=1 Tax=Piromyces finnis TaxID=1754191 RepID=A0A1Y1VP20_9FUNG|nr:hypothetical protein BCR36DRAFT_341489 [Piromyces finnis]|eukprot:ORX61158.1 hypothetical protein BCR36DRAFT_341489 [Piromyces finnis]